MRNVNHPIFRFTQNIHFANMATVFSSFWISQMDMIFWKAIRSKTIWIVWGSSCTLLGLEGGIGDCLGIVSTVHSANPIDLNFLKSDPIHAWGRYICRNIDIVSPCGCSFAEACLVINLDKRVDRWIRSIQQLTHLGIQPSRVPAVWGAGLPSQAFAELGTEWNPLQPYLQCSTFQNGRFEWVSWWDSPKTFFSHHMNLGGIGCYLSHLSALLAAHRANLRRVWILEDDFFIQAPLEAIEAAISEADSLYGEDGWDLLYTSPWGGTFNARPDVDLPLDHMEERPSKIISVVHHRWKTDSMIWNRCGIEKILSFLSNRGLYGPIDHDLHSIPGLNQLQSRFALTQSRDDMGTDIQGKL